MFFPEKIKSITPTDRVLEIGPGATPYFRADVFLEKKYESDEELIAQSGRVGILQTNKKIVTYNGGHFPFEDKEFDYIICSHVLEHVDNPDYFLNEIQRVGKRGYLEFPTLYYDYIYNIPEHKLLLLYKNEIINWMTKEESGLLKYSSIHDFFFFTIELGYHKTIIDLKEYFFQGFEWFDKIESKKVNNINELTYSNSDIHTLTINPTINKVNYENISLKEHLSFKLKNKTKISTLINPFKKSQK